MVKLPVNLNEAINWLSAFGKETSGGITRTLYSQPWIDAQAALKNWLEQLHLNPYFDHIGNLFGRLPAKDKNAPVILTGSHVDTVKGGGKYDGAFGILAGILALNYLKQNFGDPRRNIEIVSFCEEEGSRFPLACWGSGVITGAYTINTIEGLTDIDGVNFKDAMMSAGFVPANQESMVRKDIAAFVELHIEQGPKLEELGKSIGIVQTIVGQKRFRIAVKGESNHAGTTLMKWRKDPVRGAAAMIHHLYSCVKEYDDDLVTTVGQFIVEPNIPNVIARETVFTVDARHPLKAVLDSFCCQFSSGFQRIAEEMDVSVNIELYHEVPPAGMNSGLNQMVESLCQKNGISYHRMHSGAGHDSQLFASFCPTALIFVPSNGGISHSQYEYTSNNDLETGLLVLIRLLHHLAYE